MPGLGNRQRFVTCLPMTSSLWSAAILMASQKLLVHLHRQLSRQQERISSLATESVLDRLIRILRMLPFNPKIEKINLTHEELAQMVGTSRQTVSTMLKNLQDKGLVTKKDGQYLVTDVS
jgi:CRP/FNR family transcriptional regulator, cyclic AMP receptor protein